MLPISLNLERKHLYLQENKKSFSQTCSKTPGSKCSAEHPFVVIQQTLASGGDQKRERLIMHYLCTNTQKNRAAILKMGSTLMCLVIINRFLLIFFCHSLGNGKKQKLADEVVIFSRWLTWSIKQPSISWKLTVTNNSNERLFFFFCSDPEICLLVFSKQKILTIDRSLNITPVGIYHYKCLLKQDEHHNKLSLC